MSGHRKAEKAVILAGGLGKRMRSEADEVSLTAEQKAAANAGLKAIVPLADGRSLLELSLANLNAAGFVKFVIVVGAESEAIGEHCARLAFDIDFAVQEKPLGTANALLAAEASIGDELFGVFNSDNLYPVEPLRELIAAAKPAMLLSNEKRLSNAAIFPKSASQNLRPSKPTRTATWPRSSKSPKRSMRMHSFR